MKRTKILALCSPLLILAACASTPMGPTVHVMPPAGKSFDQFQGEQLACKQFAEDQVRGQADNANSTALLEGLGGTVLGAGLGAAIGGGHGAAVGAAGGAIAGTAVGANTSSQDHRSIQQQYNIAFEQCMTSKGNQLPQAPVPQQTVIYTQPAPQQPTVVYVQQPPAPPPTVIYTQPQHY